MARTRILVTGATGFIGSVLVEELLKEERYEVWSFERYVTGRYGDPHRIPTVFGDLRFYNDTISALMTAQPHVIIHLAAISPVSYSLQEHPQEVNETNYLGTINLITAARKYSPNLKHFIFASTSETYGNIPTPFNEEQEQMPVSPYGVSKLAAEKYLQYEYRAHDMPITISRAHNTYGRIKDHHFFIETVIYQMLTSNVVRLGNKDAFRDFMYVTDHTAGYHTLLDRIGDRAIMGKAYNFCSGQNYPIEEIVERLRRIIGFAGTVAWDQLPRRADDIRVLYGTYAKAQKELGWEPHVPIDEGLELTVRAWKKKLAAKPRRLEEELAGA